MPEPMNTGRSHEEHIGGRDLTRWTTPVGQWLVKQAVALARLTSTNSVLVLSATVGAVLITGMLLASAEVYESVEDANGVAAFDRPALDAAVELRTPANAEVVTIFTHLGGFFWMAIITAAITVTLAVIWRSKTPVVLMTIAVTGSLLMTRIGKEWVGRIRPPLTDAVPPFESSPSFPSGHTLNSTVIAGVLAYLVMRRLHSNGGRVLAVVVAITWAVAMGLSRVFLGHHWLTDVAIGWTLGIAWVAAVVTAHRLYLTVRRRDRHRSDANPLLETIND